MTISSAREPRPPPTLSVELTGEFDQLADLRRQCAAMLRPMSDRVIGDVQLVVSELVSNVLRHTRQHTGQLVVRRDATDVHIAVSDLSPVPPRLARDATVGGRGVQLVDAVAWAWGVTSERHGKTVWADIHVEE